MNLNNTTGKSAVSCVWSVSYLIILVCSLYPASAHGGDWRWQRRLDLSLLHDNNVYESLNATQSAVSSRLLVDIAGKIQASERTRFALGYKGGLETYTTHTAESRMAHDLQARSSLRIADTILLGISVHCRNKLFFQNQRGYMFYRTTPQLAWAISSRTSCTLLGSFSGMNYRQGRSFDLQQNSLGATLEHGLSRHWTGKLQYTIHSRGYKRNALDYQSAGPDEYIWIDLQHKQEDTQQEIAGSLEFYRWALIRCDLVYAFNSSNSYGFAYRMPKIRLLAAKALPYQLTLSLYWNLLLKEYTDDLQPLLQLSQDTENEESSHVVIDIAKDLPRQLTVRARLGWYRHESPFRDLYYDKIIVSTGIAKRF